jgi:hypothetical protein
MSTFSYYSQVCDIINPCCNKNHVVYQQFLMLQDIISSAHETLDCSSISVVFMCDPFLVIDKTTQKRDIVSP